VSAYVVIKVPDADDLSVPDETPQSTNQHDPRCKAGRRDDASTTCGVFSCGGCILSFFDSRLGSMASWTSELTTTSTTTHKTAAALSPGVPRCGNLLLPVLLSCESNVTCPSSPAPASLWWFYCLAAAEAEHGGATRERGPGACVPRLPVSAQTTDTQRSASDMHCFAPFIAEFPDAGTQACIGESLPETPSKASVRPTRRGSQLES
jgi:hypothetical protein